jgi:hypothetical protein
LDNQGIVPLLAQSIDTVSKGAFWPHPVPFSVGIRDCFSSGKVVRVWSWPLTSI